MLKRLSIDYISLPTELLSEFKDHLRILDDLEDTIITSYLSGAIDAIARYGSRDIFDTSYSYERLVDVVASPAPFWRCSRVELRDVQILDANGVDITGNYKIDTELGYFVPTISVGDKVTFSAGYLTADDIPPNLKIIIFRYGAHLFENREAINVGAPKHLPDWVPYALASIWVPRI